MAGFLANSLYFTAYIATLRPQDFQLPPMSCQSYQLYFLLFDYIDATQNS